MDQLQVTERPVYEVRAPASLGRSSRDATMAMSPDPGIGPGGSNPCDLGTALFQRVFGYQTGTHWADVVVCLGRPNPRTFVPTTPGWTYAGCASCCRSHLRDVPPSCVATCISECNRIRYWVEFPIPTEMMYQVRWSEISRFSQSETCIALYVYSIACDRYQITFGKEGK